MGMTREEAREFIAQSVKSDVDMAKVADALEALDRGLRKGHWIHRNAFIFPYKCSECNYISEKLDNFCPNCSADMREVEDDN